MEHPKGWKPTPGPANCITAKGNSPQMLPWTCVFNKHLLRDTPPLQTPGPVDSQGTEKRVLLGGGHSLEGKTLMIIHDFDISFHSLTEISDALYQCKQCVKVCISRVKAVTCLLWNRKQCEPIRMIRSEPWHRQMPSPQFITLMQVSDPLLKVIRARSRIPTLLSSWGSLTIDSRDSGAEVTPSFKA